MTLYYKACSWAIQKHKETNHLYDGNPYDIHLWQVVDIAKMFSHHIPEGCREIVFAACWLHDTIEDCRVTYNDVKQEFGEELAEIVYALTNEKGRTRKDRASAAYYQGIKETRWATFVKLCDRIANIKYSLENGSRMFEMYKKESADFKSHLSADPYEYRSMWNYMESILEANWHKEPQ